MTHFKRRQSASSNAKVFLIVGFSLLLAGSVLGQRAAVVDLQSAGTYKPIEMQNILAQDSAKEVAKLVWWENNHRSMSCDFWKGLLCVTPISSCALTAGFGGADKLYQCVNAGASWCAECVEGFSDPRDKEPNSTGGGPGVVCSSDGCHYGSLAEGLTIAPTAAMAGPWKLEDLNVATSRAPSLIQDSSQKVAFYVGPNGHLWMSTHANNGQWWSKASDLGGVVLASAPAAIAPANNIYRVFYKGPTGHLWMSSWDGGQWWSAPTDLGGVVLASAPTAISLASNKYRVFYKGPNGHLWMSSWDGGQWWSAPTDLGGVVLASAPAAVTIRAERDHIAVFYVGPNGHLTMSAWSGGPWWSAPIDLGGINISGDLSAVSPVPHEIDVFYSSSSGELTQSQWIGGPWWSAPYGRTVHTTDGGGAISGTECYIRGPNGHLSVVHP